MDKGEKDKLVGSPGENGGGQDAQKDLHARTGMDETKRSSSSAGSEKMERVGDRYDKMEGKCSTGQGPQWVVVPMEEEKEDALISQIYSWNETLHVSDSSSVHHHEFFHCTHSS